MYTLYEPEEQKPYWDALFSEQDAAKFIGIHIRKLKALRYKEEAPVHSIVDGQVYYSRRSLVLWAWARSRKTKKR